jgi:hypothetical protein
LGCFADGRKTAAKHLLSGSKVVRPDALNDFVLPPVLD